jgi:hypothetical protein
MSDEGDQISMDNEGGTSSIGSEECVICFLKLKEDVGEVQSNGKINEECKNCLDTYLETPCRHRYHEKCLRAWL